MFAPWLLLLFLTVTANGAPTSPRLFADHERHPALLIGASQMMFHHQQALLDIARALQDEAPVYGLVADEAQARRLRDLLTEHGLSATAVLPVEVPVQSMWVRDYGPLFVRRPAGDVVMVDPRYGGTSRNPDDEEVPSELAEQWHVPSVDVPLWMEGGHVVTNGAGLVLVSNALLNKNVAREGIGAEELGRRIGQALPFDRLEIVLPLHGEPTGHLDMFLGFLAPDVLLVARIDPAEDATNAERLDGIAAKFAGVSTPRGPLRVLRVDTPPATDGVWRTYTNAAMVDDVVLVPSYPDLDQRFDRDALAVYREAMPNRKIVAIDAESLVEKRGALHCVSVPLPPSVHRALVRSRAAEAKEGRGRSGL